MPATLILNPVRQVSFQELDMNIIEKLHQLGVRFVERFINEKKLERDLDKRLQITAREVTMRQTRGNPLIRWGQYDDSYKTEPLET